jgi:aminopeptidase N
MKWILGETAFYNALKDYHARPALAYNYVRTADFKNSVLISTNKDFTEFFNDWIYGQGYPTYDIRWKQTGNVVAFKASQTQSDASVSFFEMPLPIKVNGTLGEVAYFSLDNSYNNQYFFETVNFTVASVQFNYEYQIIEKNSTVAQDTNLKVDEIDVAQFALYPNPAKNEIFLKGIKKSADFTIFSADGRLVKKYTYKPGNVINISSLVPGVYVLQISGKNLKFVKK